MAIFEPSNPHASGLGVIKRKFVSVPDGEVHYAEAGKGPVVLLLHQTPRSWTEYRHVIPLLSAEFRVIAMDTIGYGDSSKPPEFEGDSIEGYAKVAVDFMHALELDRASLVGHHTGSLIAIEVAATAPSLVERLILSCTPMADEIGRRLDRPVDDFEEKDDGSHLVELWRFRQAIYPTEDRAHLTSFIIDALKAGPRAAEGHRAVRRYLMEEKLPQIQSPTLLLAGRLDPTNADLPRLRMRLPDAEVIEFESGGVPLPEQMSAEFSAAVREFLR